jgi:spore maturation protein A
MLNYIWAGLIIASLVFAMVNDIGDLSRDRYRNQQPLPVELVFPQGYDPGARRVPVEVRIDPGEYAAFYGVEGAPAGSYAGYLRQTSEGIQLRFEADASFPEPLATIAGVSRSTDDELQGTLVGFTPQEAATATGLRDDASVPVPPAEPAPVANAGLVFDEVRFVKLNAIAAAALSFARTAAEIALGLIGVLALFLGILKIAEDAGVIYALVKLVRPLLRPLFPEVPPDHPALGLIALNMTANIFGLGNAATPFGIKAMEELQKLNPTEDTATNPMVMLLAVNTASVQLVPPVLLIALMGLQINQLIFAIIITTGFSLVVAIVAAKLYGRLPATRASDPNRNPPPDAAPNA